MKKITLLSILLVSVVLAACSSSPVSTFNPYIGGTEGIRMEFIEGLPPTQVGAILDGGRTEFGVGVRLTNAGETDIEPGDLTLELRGILPEQYGISSSDDLILTLDEEIPGSRKNFDGSIIEGLFTTLAFEGLSFQPDLRGDDDKTMQVALCYEYQTKSTTPICVSGDTTRASTNSDDQSICAISGQKNVQNSGGPVQITSFSQIPQGRNKISIAFEIAHVGQGKIYEYNTVGTEGACDDSVTNRQRNVVLVSLDLSDESISAGARLSCSGLGGDNGLGTSVKGDVTLFEGTPRTVTCTVEADQDVGIYEDLINIDLDYAYGQEMETTIIVKDAGTDE